MAQYSDPSYLLADFPSTDNPPDAHDERDARTIDVSIDSADAPGPGQEQEAQKDERGKIQAQAYPERLPKRLNVTIFPMEITKSHCITYNSFIDTVKPLADAGSPLSTLAYTFMKGIHDNCLND
ncbi:hypothetical protein HYE67_002895 [Fusarium culmorum]|uniref:Uncharacterized protein n=1 Tax=Fusarium culmorum TaxID=5516 RepID=A0A2T4GVN6_FUSCU|nr:hypothetical protein FCULG_00007267 [Fusarium culmorum]QPC60664.1 hypothetical protein HYE67_002895 [Fusarium culmorum]